MICASCRVNNHQECQSAGGPTGSPWCNCQHRPPLVVELAPPLAASARNSCEWCRGTGLTQDAVPGEAPFYGQSCQHCSPTPSEPPHPGAVVLLVDERAPYTVTGGRPPVVAMLPPGARDAIEYLSVPKSALTRLVGEYVMMIETQVTNTLCKCEWIVHPDDVDKPEGKRRVRQGYPDMNCPVHTKEGFLFGFFTWLFREEVEHVD